MYNNSNPAVYLWRNIEINAIKRLIRYKNLPNIVYDLGCGDKTLSKYIFQDKDIVGIDIQGKPDISASIYSLPFDNNSIDFIFCNSVLEHLNRINLALYNINRVLKKGGIFIFTVPNDNLEDNLPFGFGKLINKLVGHKNLFCYMEWKQYLLDNNLKILSREYYLDDYSTIEWSKMLLLQKLFGGLFLNRRKLDRTIKVDINGVWGSAIAFLVTKI